MPEIEIIDECQDHNYFSLVPNIIYSIGLNSNQIAIYCAIKMVTGEKRDCTMCMKKLAAYAGMSRSTFKRWYPTLSEINKFLKKPLVVISQRVHENGDQDTNSLKIVDIWKVNVELCSEKEGGRVKLNPPQVKLNRGDIKLNQGVGSNCTGGRVKLTHKQEDSNKKDSNKTATPTPFKGEAAAAASISAKEIKAAAEGFKAWLDNEACIVRKRPYNEEVRWGDPWIFPLKVYEDLIRKHGLDYFREQLEFMYRKQMLFERRKTKIEVNSPEIFLRASCDKNYADAKRKGEV